MRWRGKRKSSNVEDRRNTRVSGLGGLGGSGGGILRLLPVAFKFLGFKGSAILILCVGAYGLYTGSLGDMLGGLGLQQGSTTSMTTEPLRQSAEEKELVDFISVVLADTEETWNTLFREMGKTYKEPRLILFRDAVKSACGMAESAMGPFYCPADQQVYIDLGFYDQLKNRFKAPGDFAQAYVIAHEVGHHIQTLLGISSKVHAKRSKLNEVEANKLSVKQELQADCLAGVWAHHASSTRQLLEAGDVEEGLTAASAIGDDTLQKQSKGFVSPDSFTHGSSAQRVKWFKIGLASGDIEHCDTFTTIKLVGASASSLAKPAIATGSGDILAAIKNQRSDVQVQGRGVVSRLLPDDNEGSRHQKFIVKLSSGQSVLIAHNIDLAPRIAELKTGDNIAFYGEYEWNEKGGVLHWTHDDPAGRHEDGWLKHNRKIYQ